MKNICVLLWRGRDGGKEGEGMKGWREEGRGKREEGKGKRGKGIRGREKGEGWRGENRSERCRSR